MLQNNNYIYNSSILSVTLALILGPYVPIFKCSYNTSTDYIQVILSYRFLHMDCATKTYINSVQTQNAT